MCLHVGLVSCKTSLQANTNITPCHKPWSPPSKSLATLFYHSTVTLVDISESEAMSLKRFIKLLTYTLYRLSYHKAHNNEVTDPNIPPPPRMKQCARSEHFVLTQT